jgi:hypothetical protein
VGEYRPGSPLHSAAPEFPRWTRAPAGDRFGESAVSLGSAVKGTYLERTHENPAGLPGKRPKSEPRP